MASSSIFTTADGSHTLISNRFGESYHSRHGAIQESQHIFIDAGFMTIQKHPVKILELGLGTGLNTLLTLKAAVKQSSTVYYDALEAFPITPDQANQLNYPKLVNLPRVEQSFSLLHSCEWGTIVNIIPKFYFKKWKTQIQDFESKSKYDLIYFDAFAPSTQPELWGTEVLSKMYNLLEPEGILVTYCAKGIFKKTLKSIGFKVETLPGPPGKREMTRAHK